MLTKLDKVPFPFFGGKSQAAPLVWSLLGDTDHYVEPFMGSLAVLLNRPHPCNRAYYSETVNDADGFVCNAWRSMQMHPEETAHAGSWPVCEADKQARQIRLLEWKRDHDLEHLMGDPLWCDPVMAGWWIWAVSVQIGAFAGNGPWIADPATGRIMKQPRGPRRGREPGVTRDLPHLAGDGQGINRPQAREPGVYTDEDESNEFHPITMPEITRWFRYLSARLRHVRILNGDWKRVCTTGAMWTLPVRMGDGHVGVFLDPPYANGERTTGLYAHDDGDVAAECLAWCVKNGDHPRTRIVLAGYDTEHAELTRHGWTVHEWFTAGFLRGGMAQQGQDGHQQGRERLWASPHCLTPGTTQPDAQLSIFG